MLLGREKPPALLEESVSSDMEEGEEELPTAPLPTGTDLEVADTLPTEQPGPPMHLPLPGPISTEGLAEAALEDGECCGGASSGDDPPHRNASLSPR